MAARSSWARRNNETQIAAQAAADFDALAAAFPLPAQDMNIET